MKNKTILSMIFILVICIFIKAFLFASKYISDEYNKEYSLFVISKYKENDSMVAYNVFLENDKFIMKIYQSDSVDLKNYKSLKYGDFVNIIGKIVVPEYMNNPGEFNYKYYLYSNNIHGEISINKINSVGRAKLNLKQEIFGYIYEYKAYLGKVLEEYMPSDNVELAKSVIYGETFGLDEDTKNSFEQTGLSYIMAISGANITSIITVITILMLSLKLKGKVSNIVALVVIFIYVILAGSSLSTLRACIMASISIIFNLINKKIHPLKSLFLTGAIILFFYPYSIFNTGCILSFLATFGIITLLKPLNKLTHKLAEKVKINWLKKVIEFAFLNFWLTISVQAMIMPVQINSFNTFSPTQVVFNICISGITNLITILGSIFFLFSYVPMINFLIVKCINICVYILILSVDFLRTISLNISIMDLPVIVIVIYYCIVLSFVFKIHLNKFLRGKKYKLNKKAFKRYSIIQIILIFTMIITVLTNTCYFKNIISFVYFFNVGQGETSYIKSGKNSIIVDIGSIKTNLAFNTVSNYFKMKNISGVDAIILSHMHIDHINGLEKYLENYSTKIILYSKPVKETEAYIDFKEIVAKHNVKTKEVKAGEIYKFGNIKIEILLPKYKLLNVEDDINANSLVCKISVKDKNIMYMGDGTIDTEKQLLKLYDLKDIDILKVGHHGSKTSTSEEYVKQILPKYAVISAKKKIYNHPHQNVIEILKKYNVKIYITEKIGAIKFNMYNL